MAETKDPGVHPLHLPQAIHEQGPGITAVAIYRQVLDTHPDQQLRKNEHQVTKAIS